jgi:excisionase family DNA binding protein
MDAVKGPAFYTVREAAELLRVDPATVYRSIREDSFPAVRIRSRYVVPAKALDDLVREVVDSQRCVNVGDVLGDRRRARELGQRHPEWR